MSTFYSVGGDRIFKIFIYNELFKDIAKTNEGNWIYVKAALFTMRHAG